MASIQPTKVPKMDRPKKGFNKYAEQSGMVERQW